MATATISVSQSDKVFRDYLRGKPVCLWSGPSALDPSRRVALVLTVGGNSKTGDVHSLAIYDLDASDGEPIGAGCGACPLHLAGSCYVESFFADIRHHKRRFADRASFPVIRRSEWSRYLWKRVRFGSYGDPSSLPVKLIEAVTGMVPGFMGYTHFWATCDQSLRRFFLASCETLQQVEAARALGWRVFYTPVCGSYVAHDKAKARVVKSLRAWLGANKLKDMVICPNFVRGQVVQCSRCPIGCDGTSGKRFDVINPAHGIKASLHPGDMVPLLPIVS